jgi:hypothetical protein
MEIGDRLNQRYTLTAHLGSGAMGDVFEAADALTGQPVAIKVLDRRLTLQPEMLERFKREGEALRQLRHGHIVSFVDTFQHEGQQVIVMECVSGGSLHQLIKRGPLPAEQARQIAIDLCDALTSAHRLHIIHRDIKPENVLMAPDGTPKLTDFGVARLVGEGTRLTTTGTQIGTPFYMSPEAWQGLPADAQTDIWSLGVVLYEMLAGTVPFGGETLVAVMNKVLTAPLPDLKRLRPDTPAALADIVQRMLERDRARRYPTMREVAVDLERGTLTPAPAVATVVSAHAPAAPVKVTVRKPPEPPPPAPPPAAPKRRAGGMRWFWVLGALVLVGGACLLALGGGVLAMRLMGQASPVLASPTALIATLSPTPYIPSASDTPPSAAVTLPPSDTPALPRDTPAPPSDTPAPSSPTPTPVPPSATAAPTDTPAPVSTAVGASDHTIVGSVTGSDGKPIGAVDVAVIQGQARVDVNSGSDGTFSATIPRTSNPDWNVQVVGIGCTSGVMDCNSGNMVGYFEQTFNVNVTVPQSQPIAFIFEKATTVIQGQVPAGGLRIFAARSDGALSWGTSSSSGAFKLPAGDGSWEVYAVKFNPRAESSHVTVTIAGGGAPAPVTLAAP